MARELYSTALGARLAVCRSNELSTNNQLWLMCVFVEANGFVRRCW